jgi:S-DNA-T family DNA segregation ATPase FtsK/SpoIIIE
MAAGLLAQIGRELGGLAVQAWDARVTARGRGAVVAAFGVLAALSLATHDAGDRSWNVSAEGAPGNWLGEFGANISDLGLQSMGLAAWAVALLILACGAQRLGDPEPQARRGALRTRAVVGALGALALAGVLAAAAVPAGWPFEAGLGGFWGAALHRVLRSAVDFTGLPGADAIAALFLAVIAVPALVFASGVNARDLFRARAPEIEEESAAPAAKLKRARRVRPAPVEETPELDLEDDDPPFAMDDEDEDEDDGHPASPPLSGPRVSGAKAPRPPAERKSPAITSDPDSTCPASTCWPSPSRGPPTSTRRSCAATPPSSSRSWPSSACAARSTRSAPARSHPL